MTARGLVASILDGGSSTFHKLLLREALFPFGTFTAELRKSVRSVPFRIIITFCRAANEVDDSVLVKYVIFEKFRSDPEKYRC